MRIAVIIASALFFAPQIASAKSITAASGQPQQANSHHRFDRTGKSYPINVAITKPPAHGKVTTRRVQGVISADSCASGDAACLAFVGKAITNTVVIYTSKKGYRGSDSFSYTRSSSDPADKSNGRSFDVNVTVN